MKITQLLAALQKPDFAFELMPLKGQTTKKAFARFEKLLQLKPVFVDIPYHSENYVPAFSQGIHTVSGMPRPTTEEIAAGLLSEYSIPPLAHLVCRNFSKADTEAALLELWRLGVKNILLLRGDKSLDETGNNFPGHIFAFEMVNQVKKLNQGFTWQGKAAPVKTDFSIGVAGYPENHSETPDFGTALSHLKQKQDAGAEFIITQLFYDNATYFRFKEGCRQAGISIPIIPAIAPLTSRRKLTQLPEFFKVALPPELKETVKALKEDAQIKGAGIDWAIKQTEELLLRGEKLVHFFAFSEPEATETVVKTVYKKS